MQAWWCSCLDFTFDNIFCLYQIVVYWIFHKLFPFNVGKKYFDLVLWSEVIKVKQQVNTHKVNTLSNIDDVFVFCKAISRWHNEQKFFVLWSRWKYILTLGVPFDKFRGKLLKTYVTELELEFLVKPWFGSEAWIRAKDCSKVNNLFEIFLLNLAHKWNPLLASFEAV